MGPWLAAGKRVNLVMWATGYNGRSKATPDYVFEKGQFRFECPNFGRVPVFWEKDFMKNYQAFMAAAVEKYGSNPQVGYIRTFGLGWWRRDLSSMHVGRAETSRIFCGSLARIHSRNAGF